LKDNHADRVCDDVVQLAGDAGSFFGNRVLRRALLLFKPSFSEPPASDRPAGHPRTADEEREEKDG